MPILKNLLEDKEKKQRWLIKNVLPLNEISILYAPKDHHKTGMAIPVLWWSLGAYSIDISFSGSTFFINHLCFFSLSSNRFFSIGIMFVLIKIFQSLHLFIYPFMNIF